MGSKCCAMFQSGSIIAETGLKQISASDECREATAMPRLCRTSSLKTVPLLGMHSLPLVGLKYALPDRAHSPTLRKYPWTWSERSWLQDNITPTAQVVILQCIYTQAKLQLGLQVAMDRKNERGVPRHSLE